MFSPTQPEWHPLTRRRVSKDEVQYFLDLYVSLANQRGVDVPAKLLAKVEVAKSKKSDDCRFSRLSLKKVELSDDQVKVLALTLWQFPILGQLDLRFNAITHHGVLALVELMRYQMYWAIEKPGPNGGPPVIDDGGAKLVCLHTIRIDGNPVDPNVAVIQELDFHVRIAAGNSARLALWYAFDDNDRGHKGYLIPIEAQSAVYDVLGFATKHWTAAKVVLRSYVANEQKITLPEFQGGLLFLLEDKRYGGLESISLEEIRNVAAWASTGPPEAPAFDVFPRRRESSLGSNDGTSALPKRSGTGFLGALLRRSSSGGSTSSLSRGDSNRLASPSKRKGLFATFSRDMHSEAEEGGGGTAAAAAAAAGGSGGIKDDAGRPSRGGSMLDDDFLDTPVDDAKPEKPAASSKKHLLQQKKESGVDVPQEIEEIIEIGVKSGLARHSSSVSGSEVPGSFLSRQSSAGSAGGKHLAGMIEESVSPQSTSNSPQRQHSRGRSMERKIVFGHPVYTPVKNELENDPVAPDQSSVLTAAAQTDNKKKGRNNTSSGRISQCTIDAVLFDDNEDQQQEQQAITNYSTPVKPPRKSKSVESLELDPFAGGQSGSPRPDIKQQDEDDDEERHYYEQQKHTARFSGTAQVTSAIEKDCQLTGNKLALRQLGFDSVDLIPTIERRNLGSKLLELDLSSNQLRSIDAIALAFKQLHKLRYLDLSNNCIEDMRCQNGHYPRRLEVLNLSHNYIPAIAGLETCRRLESLNLAGNHIRFVDGINHLASLTVLDISCNLITKPIGLRILSLSTSIRDLAIHGNPVAESSASGKVAVITFMPNLEVLDGEKRPHSFSSSKGHSSPNGKTRSPQYHVVGSGKPLSRTYQQKKDEERSSLFQEIIEERRRAKAYKDRMEERELKKSPPVPAAKQRKHIGRLSEPRIKGHGVRRDFEMAFGRHREVAREVVSPKRRDDLGGNDGDLGGNDGEPGARAMSIHEFLARSASPGKTTRGEGANSQEALRRSSSQLSSSDTVAQGGTELHRRQQQRSTALETNTPGDRVGAAVEAATSTPSPSIAAHNNESAPRVSTKVHADTAQAILAQVRLEDWLVDVEQDIATTTNAIQVALRIEEEGAVKIGAGSRHLAIEKLQSVCEQLSLLKEMVLPANLQECIKVGSIADDSSELRLINERLAKDNDLKRTLNTLLQLMLREPEGSGAVTGFGIQLRDTYGLSSPTRTKATKKYGRTSDEEVEEEDQLSLQESLDALVQTRHPSSISNSKRATSGDTASHQQQQQVEGTFSLTVSSDGESSHGSFFIPPSTLSTPGMTATPQHLQYDYGFLDSPEVPRQTYPVPIQVSSHATELATTGQQGGGADTLSPASFTEGLLPRSNDSGDSRASAEPAGDLSLSASYGTFDLPTERHNHPPLPATHQEEPGPVSEQIKLANKEEDGDGSDDEFARRLDMEITGATVAFTGNLAAKEAHKDQRKESIEASAPAAGADGRYRAPSSPIVYNPEEEGEHERTEEASVTTAAAASSSAAVIVEAIEQHGNQLGGLTQEIEYEWVESYDDTYEQYFYHNERTGVSQWHKPEEPYLPYVDSEDEEDEASQEGKPSQHHHHHHHYDDGKHIGEESAKMHQAAVTGAGSTTSTKTAQFVGKSYSTALDSSGGSSFGLDETTY